MTTTVFVLVLCAAVMHASWNVLVKLKLDRFSAVVLLQTVLGGFGLGMILIFGLPPAAAFPYAIASGFVHTFYLVFLAKAYEAGDFSLAYPVLRGTAPLFTLLGTLLFVGDVINPQGFGGVVIVILGLLALAFGKGRGNGKALGYALITAALISAYTLLDGLGARASGNATQYAGLAFFIFGTSILATGIYQRGSGFVGSLLPYWKSGMMGGSVSAVAYWIIIWCMAQAPIAMVAALRETSVLFGLVMASYFLDEKLTPLRILGCVLIVAGAATLRLA